MLANLAPPTLSDDLLSPLRFVHNYPLIFSSSMEDCQNLNILEKLKLKERRKCNDLLIEFLLSQKLSLSSPHPYSSIFFHPPQLSSHPSSAVLPLSSSSFSSCPSSSSSTPSIASSPSLSMNKKGLKEGQKSEKSERMYKCDQCQKAFRFKSNLFEHKSLHAGTHNRTPFVCPFCAKTCRLKGNLKKHLQVHVTSAEDLERLWKRSFSRNCGRPRKNALPAPLPKPGDDLGLVPVILQHPQKSLRNNCSSVPSPPTLADSAVKWTLQAHPQQWTYADEIDPSC